MEFDNPCRHWTFKGKIILRRKNISLFSVGPSLRWDVYSVYNLANLKFLNSFRHEVGRRLCWGERISHSFQLDRAKGEMTSLQKWTMGERGLRRKDEHPFWTPPRKMGLVSYLFSYLNLLFHATLDRTGVILVPSSSWKGKDHLRWAWKASQCKSFWDAVASGSPDLVQIAPQCPSTLLN